MLYSIKSPKAILWKIGFSLDLIKEQFEKGNVNEEWLVCPVGESEKAVKLAPFLENPDILRKEVNAKDPTFVGNQDNKSISIACFGWCVFVTGLSAYFLITCAVGSAVVMNGKNLTTNTFVVTALVLVLIKGLEALILAGAFTAMFGHVYKIILAQRNKSE